MADDERNRYLVDWGTGLFTVFWGVWWTYVADGALRNNVVITLFGGFSLPADFIAVSLVIYVAALVYTYVGWMWMIHPLSYRTPIGGLKNPLIRTIVIVVGVWLVSMVLSWNSVLNRAQVIYGVLLSIAWIATIVAILLKGSQWRPVPAQ